MAAAAPTPDVLPSSLPHERRGGTPFNGSWMVPVYCAHCGAQGGFVQEENLNFLFWLCAACFETAGPIANHMVMPDEVFWERVKQEQLAVYGRYLSETELASIVADDASPLATLLTERRTP